MSQGNKAVKVVMAASTAGAFLTNKACTNDAPDA
jgi:hypothetical protein